MNKVLLTGFTTMDMAQLKSSLHGFELCTVRKKDKTKSINRLLQDSRSDKKVKDPFVSWKPMVVTSFQSEREQDQFEEAFCGIFKDTVHIISVNHDGGEWGLDKLILGLEESSWEGKSRTGKSQTCPWCNTPSGENDKSCKKCGGPLGGSEQGKPLFHRIHKGPPYDFMKVTRIATGFGSVIGGLAPLIIGIVFLGLALGGLKGNHSIMKTMRLVFGLVGGVCGLVGGILVFRPLLKMLKR